MAGQSQNISYGLISLARRSHMLPTKGREMWLMSLNRRNHVVLREGQEVLSLQRPRERYWAWGELCVLEDSLFDIVDFLFWS